MKDYLSKEELAMAKNGGEIIATCANPEPEDCKVITAEQFNSGSYIRCGQLEVADEDGYYGHASKYSLMDYYVEGEAVDPSIIPVDDDGDMILDGYGMTDNGDVYRII